MRHLMVVSALLFAVIVSPAGAAVAHRQVAGHGAAAPRLQADFNNDGAEDLAIGAPGESVGTVESAGAVNVLYGTVGGGLAGPGSQLFTQDTPGVASTAESSTSSARRLHPATSTTTASPTSRSVLPTRPSAPLREPEP
jgi:hypothetical protein